MKKLMIAAFAIAFAAVAQAASVTWCSGIFTELPSCTGGTFDMNECVMAYVWEFSEVQSYTDGASVWKAYTDGTLDIANAYSAQVDFILGEADVVGGSDWVEGSTVYAAILYVHNDEQDFANADYYMATFSSGVAADSGADVFDLGTGDWISTTTEAVPEPTSALMLLVGLAGLALKRKVA